MLKISVQFTFKYLLLICKDNLLKVTEKRLVSIPFNFFTRNLVYELEQKVCGIYTFINSRYICYSVVDIVTDEVTHYTVLLIVI